MKVLFSAYYTALLYSGSISVAARCSNQVASHSLQESSWSVPICIDIWTTEVCKNMYSGKIANEGSKLTLQLIEYHT